MGSTTHVFGFIIAAIFLLLPVVSVAETASTEYRHTVMTFDSSAPKNMTSFIRKAVQHSDHTAKIFIDLQKNTLFVVHHRSVSVNDLETSIANVGVLAKTVAQHNYRPEYKPILPHNPDMLLKAGRNCGATKESWKRLLLKYFH
jgi:hypothetical protein